MARYFVWLSFKGTRFSGWQVQPGRTTVQGLLEHAFSLVLRQQVAVTGAGRTDTGVHALNFVAHFEAASLPFAPDDLVYKLNRFLPEDIALHAIRQVPEDLHARFSALSRSYQYHIGRVKDPFSTDTSWHCEVPLDEDRMNQASELLLRHDDFTSFSKLHTQVSTPFCRVMEARWNTQADQLVFTITANRFLRNMVRAIVGTLLEVGKGKLPVEGFREIMEKHDRSAAGMSVPPQGLFLTRIEYPRLEIPAYGYVFNPATSSAQGSCSRDVPSALAGT